MKLTIQGRPISKKNSREIHTWRGHVTNRPSKAYLTFAESAGYQLNRYHKCFTGTIQIDYVFYMKGRLETDIDNMMGGINDILENNHILANDKNIKRGSFEIIQGCPEWKTEVTITPLILPSHAPLSSSRSLENTP